MHSFCELGTLFANQSKDIWDRLGYVRDSYKSRGILGPVRFEEETITDLLMMDLYGQGSTLALFEQTSKPNEAMWGTDFARFGQVFPEQTPPGWELEPELEELQDLLRRRRQLVEQRVQELGRLDKGVAPAVAKSTKRHIVWLEKEIARLNQEYQAGLQSSAPMARRAALYRTVPGVGALTAATLVAHLPELGHWDSKALTSLVGVAPWSRDSGQKRGQRAIRGGRRVVRRALYICAWSVIRVDGQIRRFYQSLRQRGKPGKVALVAVMRKLLLQLNAVARRGTPWVAQTG